MLVDFFVGFAASAIVGWILWVILPRGVVLTRKFPARSVSGEAIPDTWVLRNESSIPARLSKVEAIGAAFEGTDWVDLSPREAMERGFFPALDSDISGGEVLSRIVLWGEVHIVPGDGLQVRVPGNSNFRITYRRDTPLGFFEKRKVTVFGLP